MRLLSPSLLGLAILQGACSAQRHHVDVRGPDQIERSIAARGWADDIWDEISNAATCSGCQSVLLLLKGLAALGDDLFVGTIQDICKLSGAEDDDVCDGSVALEGPIIASVIRDMDLNSDTSDNFCITFLGLCEYPEVEEWSIPFPSEKPSGGRPTPSGQDPIKVVHYSDIHVDPLYVNGSNAECTKPICCRSYTEDDEPGNTESPAGPNGDHNCDVPFSLEESMYAAIREIVPDAAFTLFTGDVIDHAIWNTSQSYNEEQVGDAYGLMDDYLGLVYGTAGNHEAHPTNAFQPNSVGDQAQWIYDLLSGVWSRWIGVEGASNAEALGAYSAKYPDGNLRVISLNTNLYYRQNYWMYQKVMLRDPNGQLEWLVGELNAAEQAGENVYIIGHMPLGDSNSFHAGSHYLDQIINRYSATVVAMFFGHTHTDSFQLTYSNSSEKTYSDALTTSYIGPSLTPTSGMPAFRVYDVDPVTFAVLDSTTYIADMTDAAFQTTGPVWAKYYSAKETYGPLVDPPAASGAELSAAFWHNVTAVLEADAAQFAAYSERKSRGWQAAAECDEACRAAEVCQLRAARSEDNCYEPEPGLHLTKRSEERQANRDECGISVARAAIGALAVRKEMLEVVERRFVEERARRS